MYGRSQAEKKYKKELAALEKLNSQQKLQIDAYYNKLDSLEKEYQNALEHMDEYADLFARIDESEVDTTAQKALELFNRGEFEESIRLFEKGNYMGKLDDAMRVKEQAREMRQVADSAESLANRDMELALESIKAQIAAYKLSDEWVKAGELLKGLADKLGTFDAKLEYADFCLAQKNYSDAEVYYLKCVALLSESENDYSVVLRGRLCNNLALLYSETQRYTESELLYKSALEIRERLAAVNPSAYEPDLVGTQMNLANLYSDTQRYTESEVMYKSALEIRERLSATNPAAYEPDLAMTQMNLANLYRNTQRYTESEVMYKSALEIRERLSATNPAAYEPDLAMTQMNLANLYRNTQRYTESEVMYKSALEIYKRLAAVNPSAYEPELAATQMNLAVLYWNTQRYTESELLYKSALEIYERLAAVNPAACEPYLARTQMNLANLYLNTHRYPESEALYKSALEIRERLSATNPAAYEPNLATTQMNLANLYWNTHRYPESETLYKSALEIYERLAVSNPTTYEPYFAFVQMNLVVLYATTKDYFAAYTVGKELIPVLKRCYTREPSVWGAEYVNYLYFQSYCSNMSGIFTEGEQYELEALKIDSDFVSAHTNLAAAMLMQGKTDEAESLYRQLKSELKDGLLDDLAEMERLGVIPSERKADVARIKAILNE